MGLGRRSVRIDAQHYGVFVAQVFFGLWLAPLVYLVYRSGWFPKGLAIALAVGCVSYLVQTLAVLLLPDLSESVSSLFVLPAATGNSN